MTTCKQFVFSFCFLSAFALPVAQAAGFTGKLGTGYDCRCTGSHLRSRRRGALVGRREGHPDFRRSDSRAVDSRRVERRETLSSSLTI